MGKRRLKSLPTPIPAHPALPCSRFVIPSRLKDDERQVLGDKASQMFRVAAAGIRDSIGHPLDALRESGPYDQMADAWKAWAEGTESWAAFCRKNRRLARRLAVDHGRFR